MTEAQEILALKEPSANGRTPVPLKPTELPSQPLKPPSDYELWLELETVLNGEYAHFRGAWYRYTEGFWEQQKDIETEIYNLMLKYLSRNLNPSNRRAVSVDWIARMNLRLKDDRQIDHYPAYINLKNGLFNLDTYELEPHRRDVYITAQLEFAYDKDATCPVFRKFLNQVLTDENDETDIELISLVQQAFGYSLTADVSQRASFWVVGPKGSGKSTLINILVQLLRPYHTTIDLNQIGQNRFLLARMAGKRLVTFGESDANTRLADGLYKMMVSKDEIVADVKNKEPIHFVPEAKIWWGMNNLPVLVDRSGATEDRIVIIPFRKSIPNEERNLLLDKELEGELSGIFNFSIAGLRVLRTSGRFSVPEASRKMLEDYQRQSDTEKVFLEDWTTRGESYELKASVLYDAYSKWCKKNGYHSKTLTKVASEWIRLGLVKVEKSGSRWYRGVSLTMEASKEIPFL